MFEIRLEYKEGKEHVSDEGKVEEYLVTGEETVRGRINGLGHWSLFEAQSPGFCASNLFGVIFTDDGAEIKFDTMGFFRRPAKGSRIWQNSSGISFDTKDERYLWLTDVMGVWEGEFYMESYQYRYQIYGKVE